MARIKFPIINLSDVSKQWITNTNTQIYNGYMNIHVLVDNTTIMKGFQSVLHIFHYSSFNNPRHNHSRGGEK